MVEKRKIKFKIVCDSRESFPHKQYDGILYSDHPRLKTIQEFQECIQYLGYDCEYFGGIYELIKACNHKYQNNDSIFINIGDGLDQHYSRVQAPILLELLNVKYTNSNPFVSALLSNKHYTKLAVQEYVKTPYGILFYNDLPIPHRRIEKLTFPVIVKPNTEGSSVGITQQSVCNSPEKVEQQIRKMREEFQEILIEEYIPGYEVTNLIFGNKNNLIMNEVIAFSVNNSLFFEKEILGFKEKILKKRQLLPATQILNDDIIKKIKQTSALLMKELNIWAVARFDYRITQDNTIILLEINSAPRLSKTTELGFIANQYQTSYESLVNLYLKCVMRRLHQS